MSYQAILGRMLNVDYVNLGFSGNGRGEPELAAAVAAISASAYVLDFAQNNPTVDSLREVYAPFVETIRSKHPDTPVLIVTPIYASHESWVPDPRLEGMRELIRGVAARRIAAGDRNVQIVEGTDLLGPSRGDGLVDGTHPNDLGFEWMAEGLASRLAKMLGINVTRYRYLHTMAGGAFAGVGGACFSLAITPQWVDGLTSGAGWIAIALVIFAFWRPGLCLVGAYFFGAFSGIPFTFQARGILKGIPPELFQALPYVMTIVVLVLVSTAGARRRLGAPASLGIPYSREER